MRKIPTIFDRDWDGTPSRVLDRPHPDCGWVFAGEGRATRKLNGTCCLVRRGELFKRRDIRHDEDPPFGFELVHLDPETGKAFGWMPVGAGPEDRWHRDAWFVGPHDDGTYELIGPKVQGNPEQWNRHELIPHTAGFLRYDLPGLGDPPRSFNALRDWLADKDIEGLVWHHPDGRMGKIKGRDFGLQRIRAPRLG